MKGLMRKISLCLTVMFLSGAFCFAEYNPLGIPDSCIIRRSIVSSWLTAPFSDLQSRNRELHSDDVGTLFQVRMEEGLDEFLVIVAPQTFNDVDIIDGEKRHTERLEEFRTGSPGSWVVYRDKQTEKALRIVWYFNADSGVYIQFRPAPNATRCYADLIVFGSYAARSVPVGVAFDRLYTASFADIYQWTRRTIPWEKVTVQEGQYRDSVQVAETIKSRLGFIDYAENVSYNENGVLYNIETGKPVDDDELSTASYTDRLTLSGAGFVKWVADGFVYPLAGRGTAISDLVVPTVEYASLSKNGVISQERNLSFTLDWTRNLAAAVLSVRTKKDYTFKTGGTDVCIEPFAADLVNGVLTQTSGYIPDTGYSAKKLKGILYVLASTEPSYMYFAAVRQTSSIVPDEMVFNECAVIIPYFDDLGRFGCYVFEKGRQITLERFIAMYETSFIHLSRVKATENFFPQ